MPAQSTSADKKHQAQQARRQAVFNSANNRRRRQKPSDAAVPAQSSVVEPSNLPVVESHVDSVSSAPEKERESLFPAPDVAKSNSVAETTSASVISDATDSGVTELDALCEIADSNPAALGADLSNVRQVCRNRRKALSARGKAAVPSKNSASGRGGSAARAMAYAAGQINGRDLAKLRRQEMANKGVAIRRYHVPVAALGLPMKLPPK